MVERSIQDILNSERFKKEAAILRNAPQRDIDRIDETLNVIRQYWKSNPDMRLGQLIYNAARLATGPQTTILNAIWNAEEEDLIRGIEKMRDGS